MTNHCKLYTYIIYVLVDRCGFDDYVAASNPYKMPHTVIDFAGDPETQLNVGTMSIQRLLINFPGFKPIDLFQ